MSSPWLCWLSLNSRPGSVGEGNQPVLPVASGGAGQRLRTVIAYLNAPTAGGETDFPLLGQRIVPQLGHVLRFDNIDAHGRLNENSLHTGLPVKQGNKWICTLWMRQNTLRML